MGIPIHTLGYSPLERSSTFGRTQLPLRSGAEFQFGITRVIPIQCGANGNEKQVVSVDLTCRRAKQVNHLQRQKIFFAVRGSGNFHIVQAMKEEYLRTERRYWETSSLICVSGVTRDPAGGDWLIIVPEVGVAIGGAELTGAFGIGTTWFGLAAAVTIGSCIPARAIFSFASTSWRPTKLGIT